MDNQTQKNSSQQARADRKRRAAIQHYVRMGGIILAILISVASLLVSCSTRNQIRDLAAQIAAKKAVEAQQALISQQAETEAAVNQDAVVFGSQITMSFLGDITLCSEGAADYNGSFEQTYDTSEATYFFDNVRSILEGDDLTVANLECCLTASVDTAMPTEVSYRADPSYVSILMHSGIDAVNTANDHTHDFSDAGYVDTLATLDVAGITRFGGSYTSTVESNGVTVGLTGVNACDDADTCLDQATENITALKEDGAQIIVCYLHWGFRGDTEPASNTVELARAIVDAGADLIIGSHPRSLQGIESYKGRYICYSLGSFLDGGEAEISSVDTMIFQVTFKLDGGKVQDNPEYEIIPCYVSSNGSAENDYAPGLCDDAAADTIRNNIYSMSAALDGGIRKPTAAPAVTAGPTNGDEQTGNDADANAAIDVDAGADADADAAPDDANTGSEPTEAAD